MIAEAGGAGAAWSSFTAAVVLLLVVAALVVDRTRMKRRLLRVERSEALLRTDLADARAQIEALRDCVRTPDRESAPGQRSGGGSEPTGPSASSYG